MANNEEMLTKSFNVIEDSIEKMWLMWHASLGSFSQTQEYLQKMSRNQLDQNQLAWEEWIKMVEELGKQTRQNQQQFQKMVEEAIRNSYQYFNPSKQ